MTDNTVQGLADPTAPSDNLSFVSEGYRIDQIAIEQPSLLWSTSTRMLLGSTNASRLAPRW